MVISHVMFILKLMFIINSLCYFNKLIFMIMYSFMFIFPELFQEIICVLDWHPSVHFGIRKTRTAGFCILHLAMFLILCARNRDPSAAN